MSCRAPLTWRVQASEGRSRKRNKMNQQIWGNYWRLTVLYFNYPIFALVHHRLLNNSPIFISFSDDSMKSVNGTSRNSSSACSIRAPLHRLFPRSFCSDKCEQWRGRWNWNSGKEISFRLRSGENIVFVTKSAVTTERQRFSSLSDVTFAACQQKPKNKLRRRSRNKSLLRRH